MKGNSKLPHKYSFKQNKRGNTIISTTVLWLMYTNKFYCDIYLDTCLPTLLHKIIEHLS